MGTPLASTAAIRNPWGGHQTPNLQLTAIRKVGSLLLKRNRGQRVRLIPQNAIERQKTRITAEADVTGRPPRVGSTRNGARSASNPDYSPRSPLKAQRMKAVNKLMNDFSYFADAPYAPAASGVFPLIPPRSPRPLANVLIGGR
jgi:hypothetical protein